MKDDRENCLFSDKSWSLLFDFYHQNSSPPWVWRKKQNGLCVSSFEIGVKSSFLKWGYFRDIMLVNITPLHTVPFSVFRISLRITILRFNRNKILRAQYIANLDTLSAINDANMAAYIRVLNC